MEVIIMICFNNSFPFDIFITHDIDEELKIDVFTLSFNELNSAEAVETVDFLEFLRTPTGSVLITQ